MVAPDARSRFATFAPPLTRPRLFFVAGIIAALTLGCAEREQTPPPETETPPAPTSAAPQIVLDMIAAHGGMDAWRATPTVSFEDEFVMPGGGTPTISRVTVEQGSRRAYMDIPGTNMSAIWDGKTAWGKNWESPLPPRFLVLLNYYFLNLPWLTMDPGVKLTETGHARLWDDPTEYATVKMTFEPGTGDTPDDSYHLHIDPATKRLKAVRYVVTYQALLPPGESSWPERIVVFDAHETVSGLLVPAKYTIYEHDHKPFASCTIRDVSFSRPFDEARVTNFEGAVADTSKP